MAKNSSTGETMSQFRDLFEAINIKAVQGMPRWFKVDAEPEHVYFIVNPVTGELTKQKAEQGDREHTLNSLNSLLDLAKHFYGIGTKVPPFAGYGPVIWYSRSGVVMIFDDATGRDTAKFVLEMSPQLKEIEKLESGKKFTQNELISFLRINMRKCFAGDFVESIKNVKFTVIKEAASEQQRLKSSVGKSVRQEVSGIPDLPDYMDFNVPAFLSGFPLAGGTVEVAIDIDIQAEKFTLTAIPGSVESVLSKSEDKLGIYIAESLSQDEIQIPAYLGEP